MIAVDGLLVALLALLGLAVGSFINAAEYRLSHGLPIGFRAGRAARSHCTSCQVELGALDLVPVVSFIVLRRKCRQCREPIAWQYPLVEVATALLFVLAAVTAESPELALFYAACMGVLVFLFIYDLKHMLVLDVVTLPAIGLVLAAQFFLGAQMTGIVIGALIGGSFFAVQYLVSRGRWVGGGDIRLGLLAGAMLGWQQVLVALLLAYVGGSVIALGLLAAKRVTMKSQVPFGAFLVPAVMVALIFGEWFVDWYLSLVLL